MEGLNGNVSKPLLCTVMVIPNFSEVRGQTWYVLKLGLTFLLKFVLKSLQIYFLFKNVI